MSLPTPSAATGGPGPSPSDVRIRFAFVAETSACLADSLDLETTLATAASLALPFFGSWCMVDVIEEDDGIRRVAVIHPDPEKQLLARSFYDAHPPRRHDLLGAPRVMRTRESEFVLADDDLLTGIAGEQRALLEELGARSFLMVPMTARGRILGAITFVSRDRRRPDDADLLLAEDLGRRCAMAVDNALLYRASREAARVAEAARAMATLTARRAEDLLGEANIARYEAEAADRSKTTFLGTISHEFRTPLTAVQGFADLLMADVGGTLTESQLHHVQRIRAASDHLLTLIEEILSFATQQAGRTELRLEEVELGQLVRDAVAIIEPLAAARGLAFPRSIPDRPIPFVTDAGKLRQIILNLGANAVKFTEAGEVCLELEVADEWVVLRVTDTGIGIAPEHAEHVFAPFWQVDQSNQRAGGTGLGLAVTRRLAEVLGGEATLESPVHGGSVFTVRLPLALPVRDIEPDEPVDETVVEHRARGRRGSPRRGAG
ncbi:MAG TPA: ATP-binding protein [Longimicrobium sp.]|nr:ATP-binding protein [Longimicrobium sp.]